MSARRASLALALSVAFWLAPSLAHAQLGFYLPCTESKAKSEGRTTYIAREVGAQTTGMNIDDIEDLYCVTYVKCVALGHCKAASPEQQAAADKLKQEMAAEEARIQRARQLKAAQAERRRMVAVEERRREAAAEAAEKARRDRQAAEETKRLRLSAPDAQRLVDARAQAQQRMPPPPQTCTLDYAAYSETVDFSPGLTPQALAQKDYASVDRSKVCGGRPGTLDPLQCTPTVNFLGAGFASCKATLRCPARQETKSCTRTSAQ